MQYYEFGNFLCELRTKKGLSQFQLGSLLGVSDKAVSKWENGAAMPQSSILSKLSDILDITVDELLAAECFEPDICAGAFRRRNELWKNLHKRFSEIYGDNVPEEILNRYITETEDMLHTNPDLIVYYNLISILKQFAETEGKFFKLRDRSGNSLVANIAGTCNINPLRAHYYCPICKTVIFAEEYKCCWDLPKRHCACGAEFSRKGFNLPYESLRNWHLRKNCHFEISISQSWFDKAKQIIEDYFSDNKIIKVEADTNITFVITDNAGIKSNKITKEQLVKFPTITIDKTGDKMIERLQSETKIKATTIDYTSKEVFEGIINEGIAEFKSEFAKNIIKKSNPASFYDFLQIAGLCHGNGVWKDNGELLLESGISIGNIPAYCEDIYNYIQERIRLKGYTYTGLAYKVMEDTRKGRYKRGSGLSPLLRNCFNSLGIEKWFGDYISKVGYLFPKAFAIETVKYQLTILWYKIHYPDIFDRILME